METQKHRPPLIRRAAARISPAAHPAFGHLFPAGAKECVDLCDTTSAGMKSRFFPPSCSPFSTSKIGQPAFRSQTRVVNSLSERSNEDKDFGSPHSKQANSLDRVFQPLASHAKVIPENYSNRVASGTPLRLADNSGWISYCSIGKQKMKTLCKRKKTKQRCKKLNLQKFGEIATHKCGKCDRLACSKKVLCKAKKVS